MSTSSRKSSDWPKDIVDARHSILCNRSENSFRDEYTDKKGMSPVKRNASQQN